MINKKYPLFLCQQATTREVNGRGSNGGGNLSRGTLFTSWSQRWWMKAAGHGGSGSGQWWKQTASSPLVIDGGKAIVGG
jgi:hypothetical protein